MPKIEGDGKSWLRRSKLYKGVVEPYKKKKICIIKDAFVGKNNFNVIKMHGTTNRRQY